MLLGALATGAICGHEGRELVLYPLASLEALAGEEGGDPALYVLVLEDGLALVLRPLSPEEYAVFQVRAVGYELIEREMLAACIVVPKVKAGDVALIPPSILSAIKRAINVISGFEVFPELAPGAG